MPGTEKSCPCGSGKPFDRCCGRRKVFYSLDQVRWRRAGQDLRRSLSQFADQPALAWDATCAQDLYLGCLDQSLVDREDDFIMERCFEWFIFDYKLTSGRTVIETFRKEQSASLDERQALLLREWVHSRISLYEVTAVLPEEGITIKNMLDPGEVKISDINAPGEIEAGSVLLIRLLKVGNEYEFSTSGLALPAGYKEPLLKKLWQDREQYAGERRTNVRGWGPYLKDRAHMINAWIMSLGGPEPRPGRDSEEKKGVERRTVLPIASWREVLDAVKKEGCFGLIEETKDAAGIFRQATAAVLGKPYRSKDPEQAGKLSDPAANQSSGGAKAFLRPVIGNLILTPRFIIVSAGSPDRLSECNSLLRNLFQEIIVGEISHNTHGKVSNYSWADPRYSIVATAVRDGMQALGYSLNQQEYAVKMWFDFCSIERPSIRKASVWTAAVIYAFSRVESDSGLRQRDLADRYGLAPSTLSYRFRLLRKSLKLVANDRRYSTKKPHR